MDPLEDLPPLPEQQIDFMPPGGFGVGAVPPPTPQMQYGGLTADHILSIRQGGREENYRYNQNPQGQLAINPYDQSLADRRLQYARQDQQQRRRPDFTHNDELRLRRLDATRSWAENEFQAGRMHISNFNDVMGQVEAGSTPLEIKKQQRLDDVEKRLRERENAAHERAVTMDAQGNIVFKGMTEAALVPKEVRDQQTGEVVGRMIPDISRKDGISWKYEVAKPGPTKGETDAEIRKQAEANVFGDKTTPEYWGKVEAKFIELKGQHEFAKLAKQHPKEAAAFREFFGMKGAAQAGQTGQQQRVPEFVAPPIAKPAAQPRPAPIPKSLADIRAMHEHDAKILAKREAEEAAKRDAAAFQERQRIRQITGESQWGSRYR